MGLCSPSLGVEGAEGERVLLLAGAWRGQGRAAPAAKRKSLPRGRAGDVREGCQAYRLLHLFDKYLLSMYYTVTAVNKTDQAPDRTEHPFLWRGRDTKQIRGMIQLSRGW